MPEPLLVSMDVGAPWFLGLLVLAPLALWLALRVRTDLSAPRRVASVALRVAVVLLLVLALADLRILLENRRLAVLFLVDGSESIPDEVKKACRRYVQEAAEMRDRSREDRVGVVAFGRLAGIEALPRTSDLDLEEFVTLFEPDATDIAGAVRLAAAAFPEGCAKRIVLLTDGDENRGSVLDEVRAAREQGIVVDVVPIEAEREAEMAIEKLIVDPRADVGQPFDVRVVIGSSAAAEARLRLFENDSLVSGDDSRVSLRAGKNVIDFRGRRLDRPGRYYYEARLEPVRPEDDGTIENNVGLGLTVVEGEPEVLFVAAEPELDAPLLAALRGERIDVRTIAPESLPRTVEEYLQYDAIILSNVSAADLTEDRMKIHEALVRSVGIGFVMIGGEGSFGPGGYQGTPVERLLPVDMEIKQKRVLPNGALAIVVHSCELPEGNYWAQQVIQRSLQVLTPRDHAGVLYYGMGGEGWLFGMWPLSRRQEMLALLRGFAPGDMPSLERIVGLALEGLGPTPASIKHMVVLSDGDPDMPSQALVDAVRAQRITISTVCYGNHNEPAFLARMQDLARQGGGKSYLLERPQDLPEIFIREATRVQKALISEQRFQPVLSVRGAVLGGIGAEEIPPLDGYVLTTPKDLATVHIVRPAGAEDPFDDPVMATWTYGLGRSIAFTSDAGRRWGKDWTSWRGFQRFWVQCLRWVSRARGGEGFRLSRMLDGDRGVIVLDALTPDGRLLNGLRFRGQAIGPDRETRDLEVRQSSPGQYRAEFPVDRHGTYTVVFAHEEDGRTVTSVTGLSVPYSPEFRRTGSNVGLLRQIAEAGGGRYLQDAEAALSEGAFFSTDLPPSYDVQPIWRTLLTIAAALFFLDVFVRRVVVDYLAAVRAVAVKLVSLRGGERAGAHPDERLATLLERKEELRRAAGRPEVPPGAGAAGAGAAGAVPPRTRAPGAATPDAAEPVTPGLAPAGSGRKETTASAPPKARPAAEAPPKEESPSAEGFTSRLLEAKRRALKRDGEKETR